jgi:hypothetical protein
MKKRALPIVVFFLGIFALTLNVAPAQAQATRTWISGVGDDANPCSRTAPCKTFAGAISKTAAGGEIDVLDPGGFGALTITKAITLDGGGGQVASILTSGTNGINVIAGAGDVVILRNLRFNGIVASGSAGLSGVAFNSGAALIVEHCDVFDWANNGIAITPNTNSKVMISDTYITNTASATGNAAVLIRPTGGANVSVTINHVNMENQINGVFADGTGGGGTVHVQVKDSVITGSSNNGVTVSGSSFSADVINSQISYSVGTGAVVGSGSLKLGGNTITNNVTGVAQVGGTLQSFKNNQITDNGTDGTPITAVPGYGGTLQ